MIIISMQENPAAITVCSNFDRVIHLEILHILLEEIDTNDHMTRLRPKVHEVILAQPDLILLVVTDSLQKLTNFAENKAELLIAIKLLGVLGSIYSLSVESLGDCFKHVVSFAVKPTEENVDIAAQILESIIDFVSGKNKSCSTVIADYRTNATSLAVFSSILESVFQVIATLTENEQSESSFLHWNSGNNYVPRLVHICRVFMSSHFTYFESQKNIPIMDLLSILFKFTFSQKTTEAFLACLEIWDEFLDQLMVLEWSKFMGERPSVTYQELLVSLFNESLNKAQMQFSADLLLSLDAQETDESGETERSSFITANIEIIARICCLKPMDILSALIPTLKSTVSQFLAEPQSFTDAKIIDLGTLLQVAGRLTEHFLGEALDFDKFEDDVKALIELILELAEKLYQVLVSKSSTNSLIELHCQVLSSLRPYQHWLAQFYAKAQNTLSIDTKEKLESAPIVHLSRKVLHISIPVLLLEPTKEGQKVQKVAAQLVQCWASIVRPHFVEILGKHITWSELNELYSIGGIGPNPKNIPLAEETKNIVLRALASLFLLPYPNTTQADQKWNERAKLFACLIESQPAKFDFVSSCCFLVYSESVACRKSCAAGIRNIIYEAVPRINTFNVDIKETKAAMSLTSDYFNCMKQEATKDMELCRRTVQACFEGFSVEKANQLLLKEDGVQFLENMTKIISSVVEYCKDAEILPVVLNLTMNIILPASETSPPVHAAGLSLLKRIISVKYRYFFPGSVLSSHFKSNTAGSSHPKITNEQTLFQIIRYFITAITSTDLTLSRNALNLLLELQKERKFFSNDAVRVNINPLIVRAISSTLLAGQHLIIEDELITLLHHTFYENKVCDLQSIFTDSLPKHLTSYAVPSLNTDFPTFLSIIRSVLNVSRG
ncbi:unnamed protein product [Oikopleura dioica]|uniref:Exportin-1/Importin-beta-like domain-containing protein n=1 Tax=Oikopleura dioica TaxID=34765 RepID=E4WW95_OIKDI|nr:unnamed protein product [Oikopleura dioica]